MPTPIQAVNPWLAAAGGGDHMGQLILQAQELKAKQQYQNSLLGLEQRKLEEQIPLFQAHQSLYNAEAGRQNVLSAGERQKQTLAEELAQAARNAGAAETRRMLPNGTAIERGEGPTMAGGQEIDLANLAGSLMRVAASNPQAAAGLLRGDNVPQGNQRVNALGNILANNPKPIDVGLGHTVFPGDGSSPLRGLFTTGRGATTYDYSGAAPTIVGTGQTLPDSTDQRDFTSAANFLARMASAESSMPGSSKQYQAQIDASKNIMNMHSQKLQSADGAFADEASARAAGKGSGDKVRIKGIGLVQLH